MIRIERGTPTPEELAALVGVLFARFHAGATEVPGPGSAWLRSVRPGAFGPSGIPAVPGRSGWRASGLPR
jgi:Acyl-CoA carboxylase epsilon subunit